MSPLLEQLDKIEELRRRLWANGYRPVAVASVFNMGRSPGKRAVGGEWSDRARQDPPDAVVSEATADAMNTGILCDGLRVVDIDIDDPQVVAQVLDILAMVLPKTIARSRPNSPKLALVYRAATGQPEKKVVAFSGGKVEILGHGQQFVAFGTHPSGVDLEWKDGSPLTVAAGDLPAALESDIDLLLGLLAQVLGGTAPGDRGEAKQAEPEASLEDVASALGAIPNDGPANWDFWSRVGMAAWRATGGSEDGFEAWGQWSATHPASDGEAARERWDHWTQSSPPDRIGFGTLVYLARQADPNWQQPSKRPSGGAEFSDVPPGPDPEPEPPPRRRWLKTGSFDWSNSRPSVIDGLLAQRDVGMIFGAPGAGKSLIGPLMAATVALGKPFFGLETTSGATLYVAAEDEAGMIRRAEALSRRHGGLGEFRLSSGINSLVAPGEFEALLADAKEIRPALIVIDTLAMAWPGLKENAAEDMGTVVTAARRLTVWGAAVVIIHHDTKTGGGTPRGHSVLNGALDMAIELSKQDDSGVIRGKLTKNRNGPCDHTLAFRIGVEMLGTDRHGKPVTAAYAAELTATSDTAHKAKLSPGVRAALQVLREMATPGVAVDEQAWRDRCDDQRVVSASEDPDSRKRAMRRAFEQLIKARLVLSADGKVRLRTAEGADKAGQTPDNKFDNDFNGRTEGGQPGQDENHT